MDNEFDSNKDSIEEVETLILIDDEGNEEEFVIMDSFEHHDHNYILVIAAKNINDEESEAFILKEIEADEDEIGYEMVEDEEELELFAGILESMGGQDYDIEL